MKRSSQRSTATAWMVYILVLAIAMPAIADTPDFDIPLDYLPLVEYRPVITLGDSVTLHHKESYGVRLLSVPSLNDLEYPIGVFMNGVQGNEISRQNGFVEVAIGGNGLDAGISGYVQEEYISTGTAEAFSLPSATLKSETSLLADYTDAAKVLATHPAGTEVLMMGYLDEWSMVQVGDTYGFLKTAQLTLGEEATTGLASGMPHTFDWHTAEEKHAMDVCGAYADEKEEQYGDMDHWPLEIKAEFAALSIQLGRGQVFDLGVDIMPGPDDLQQDEAIAIAKQAITEEYPITLEQLDFLDMWFRFFDSNFYRTGRYWYFSFVGEEYDFMVLISSPDGEVLSV